MSFSKPLLTAGLLVGLIAGPFALTGCQQKSEAEQLADATATIVAKCKSSGAQSLPNLQQADIDKYCSCASSRVVTGLGIEGVRRLDKNGDMTAEDQKLMQQASAACVIELLQGLQQRGG